MKKTDFPEHVLEQSPRIHPSVFVARGAQIMGDVSLAEACSIWYNAVLRGDINSISVGARSNIQDGCILHVDNDWSCVVDNDVTVGHGAILHGCHVEEGCLIGMGSTILSGAWIGRGCIIAAGTLIRQDKRIEPFSLMAGNPARKIRTLTDETVQIHLQWAQKYIKNAALHRGRGFEEPSIAVYRHSVD